MSGSSSVVLAVLAATIYQQIFVVYQINIFPVSHRENTISLSHSGSTFSHDLHTFFHLSFLIF